MNKFNKIRILWIEDKPDSGHPPRNLGIFDEYFEVTYKDGADRNESIKSISEFNKLLKAYLEEETCVRDVLPVEIVATDYDLAKHNPAGHQTGDEDVETVSDADEGSNQAEDQYEGQEGKKSEMDFDGFLIGALYTAHFHLHPTAIVATTYQSKRMGPTVKQLEKTLKMCYRANISFAGTQRTWENILKAGVDSLRTNIQRLYHDGDIVVSINDLQTLASSPKHSTLTIVSRDGEERKLPVNGLFCDYWEESEEELQAAVISYAETLLKDKITITQFAKTHKLAKTIWNRYNDDILVQEHAQLSFLHSHGQTTTEEYRSLKNKYGLSQKCDSCSERAFDIRSESTEYTKDDRRWAGILLIRMLLKRVLMFMNNIKIATSLGSEAHKYYPHLGEDDILLLLFPIPSTPFPLPWHIENGKERSNAKSTWTKWMNRNLRFSPADILAGNGLTSGERQILQGLIIDEDTELGSDGASRLEAWRKYEPARLFLFGTESN